MNKTILGILAVFILVAIFPPVLNVTETLTPDPTGSMLVPGPSREVTGGFSFIGDVARYQRINQSQWLIQLGVVALAGFAFIAARRGVAKSI